MRKSVLSYVLSILMSCGAAAPVLAPIPCFASEPIDRPSKTLQEEPTLFPDTTPATSSMMEPQEPKKVEAQEPKKNVDTVSAPITQTDVYTSKAVVADVPVPKPIGPRYRFVGLDFQAGVPDGGSIGLILRPFYFTQFEWAGTYNGIAPGVRVGLTIDPIPWAISPTLTAEGGATFSGPVPFMSNPPNVEYKYANLHVGLAMGNWRVWRFYVRGGMSWIDLQTHNLGNAFNNTDPSVAMGDARVYGWIPSAKIGFMYLF